MLILKKVSLAVQHFVLWGMPWKLPRKLWVPAGNFLLELQEVFVMNFLGCLKNHWQKQILYKSKSMTELLGEVHSATYCVVKACREKNIIKWVGLKLKSTPMNSVEAGMGKG